MRSTSALLLLGLGACLPRKAEPCACAVGHGFVLQGRGDAAVCQCVPPVEAEPPPTPATTFSVDADEEIDWDAINAALAVGDVGLLLSGTRTERLDVLRTDAGPHRLVIDGGAGRAVVPGVLTPYTGTFHRVTVRRLEVTGSRDKGVYWRAGDEVVLEDLVIHDNRGSPAVMLDYVSRSGHASSGFTLRNSHIYDQTGECVYIGGSEGTDQDAHARVTVAGNLIHDCRSRTDTRNDGINIKDRIGWAEVTRNVIFHTDWGLELASPGLYAENVIFATERSGIHFNDTWGEGFAGVTVADTAVVSPGESGVRLSADVRPTEGGLLLSRLWIVGAGRAGITAGADKTLRATLETIHIEDSRVAFEGWGTPELTVEDCTLHGNDARASAVVAAVVAASCVQGPAVAEDIAVLSGPDHVFFTDDDPLPW